MAEKGKHPPDPERRPRSQDTETAMLEVIRSLRENPEKYRSVREALSAAKTDEERVGTLVKYATSERELAALMPAGRGAEVAAAWTTVTVTTIFILEDSAY